MGDPCGTAQSPAEYLRCLQEKASGLYEARRGAWLSRQSVRSFDQEDLIMHWNA